MRIRPFAVRLLPSFNQDIDGFGVPDTWHKNRTDLPTGIIWVSGLPINRIFSAEKIGFINKYELQSKEGEL